MNLLRAQRVGAVQVLTLDDPKRRNILSRNMCLALSAAVKAAEEDAEVKAVVIAASPPAFCAGADLEDLKAAAAGDTVNVEAVYQSFMDVANCRLPMIAAVGGAAVGAGFNLALACDIRIASDDALFDTRFLKIGLHPGGGHGWMLLRAIGWAEATRLLLLARQVHAEEAVAIGLAQRRVAPDALLDAAIALAGATDALPRELVLATKDSMRRAARWSHEESLAHETAEQARSLGGAPFKELVARLQGEIAGR